MRAQVGHKLKDKQVAKWGQLLAPQLLPGELASAMLKCNNMRPATSGIVVTNHRLGGVSDVGGWSVTFPYDTPFSMTLDAKKETAFIRVQEPYRVPASDRLRREDMLFKMVQSEDHQMLEEAVGQARAAFDPAAYEATVTEQAAQADDGAARTAAAARGEWPEGTRVRGAKLSSKASSAVLRQCHGQDDNPWLILISSGGAGVLAAWEDRLAIIKTGALTSFMAGSLGGERTATFHFVDVTGLEYNSGMLNGVLEILTPSYSGGANKDFWRGSTSSRNADSNDPWTLSNTLPLAKAEYNLLQNEIAELRLRMAKAKQPTVVIQGPAAAAKPSPGSPALAAASPATGMAAQLADLSALHDSGVLSDEEFAEAKRRVISGG